MENKLSGNLRARIIEAACRVVAKNGVNNTTLQAIADEAGISKGALYYYYRSKDRILYDMMDKNLSESAKLARQVLNKELEDEEIKAQIIAKFNERIDKKDKNKLHLYLAQEALLGNQELHAQYLAKYWEWADSIEDILVGLYGFPRSRMVRAIAVAILAVIDGMCIQNLLGLNLVERETLLMLGRLLLDGNTEEIRRCLTEEVSEEVSEEV